MTSRASWRIDAWRPRTAASWGGEFAGGGSRGNGEAAEGVIGQAAVGAGDGQGAERVAVVEIDERGRDPATCDWCRGNRIAIPPDPSQGLR